MTTKEKWTPAHNLALIYIALAYGTDYDLSDEEMDAIESALMSWKEDLDTETVQEVVTEAMDAYLEDQSGNEVIRSMRRLKRDLSEEQRRKALEDVVSVAEADGVLLSSERSLISTLAEIWSLKDVGQDLLFSSSASREEQPSWTLLHDISLMHVVVAHSTDNELSEEEIEAMIERLKEWQPGLSDEEVRKVLREVLAYYTEEPAEEELKTSVQAIKEALPVVQRLTVLDDLAYIAEIDGSFNEHEREMIAMLSQAWDIGVRLDGFDTNGK